MTTIAQHTQAILAEQENGGRSAVLGYIASHSVEQYDELKMLQEIFGGMGDAGADEYVHYWEAASYNEGFYMGQSFDLNEYLTLDDLEEARSDWMMAIAYASNALGLFYGDEWLDGDFSAELGEDLDSHYEIREAMQDSHYDGEVFEAAEALGIPFDKVDEAYAGQHDSDEDLGREFIDDIGMLADVPDSIAFYFDFEQFGRDLAMNDYSEHNGHYFHNNW